MRRYKRDTMLLVEWVDIMEDPAWMDHAKAEIEKTESCQTLGFYLNHDKHVVRLSSTIAKDQRNVVVIPLGCIKKVRKVI